MIDCVPCTGTVRRLTAQLPDGQMSFGVDVSRSKMTRGPAGHLTLSMINPSVIAAVEKLIRDDRRIKVLEIARTMQISCGSVETIIHDYLKMSKVSAR